MSETSVPARRPRRGLKWLIILVVALPILWVGYWFATRQVVLMAFSNAAKSLGAAGREVACANRALGGFPLRLDFDCGSLVFNDRDAGTAVTASRITATAPLYRPGRVDASITSPVTIDAPEHGLSLEASWENAAATADAGLGGLNAATITLDQIEIVPGAGANPMGFTGISADNATVSALPGSGNDYRFSLDAGGIVLHQENSESLPPTAVTAEVTALEFGGSLGTNPGRAIATWLADGGELQVDRLALTMGGTTAGATGRLRATAEGVVSGELNLRIVGLDQIPALAERLGLGSKDRLTRIVGMASAITRAVPENPAARDIPVTIRNGVARVGLIPLGTIPPAPDVTATPRPRPCRAGDRSQGRRSPARPR